MELSKRQLTEIRKRNYIISNLLSYHFDINKLSIDYNKKYIYIGDKEFLLGYFNNYKTLKKLQYNTINTLNNIISSVENGINLRKDIIDEEIISKILNK